MGDKWSGEVSILRTFDMGWIWKKMKKRQNIFVDLFLDHQFPLEKRIVLLLTKELAFFMKSCERSGAENIIVL